MLSVRIFLKPLTGAAKPAFHGADRTIADRGRLFVGKTLCRNKHDRFALLRHQTVQAVQYILKLDVFLLCSTQLQVSRVNLVKGSGLMIFLVADVVVEAVPEDREQPRSQVRTHLKLVEVG